MRAFNRIHGALAVSANVLALGTQAAFAQPSNPNLWHVNAAAAPGGDGEEWGTAFRFLQDAITAAQVSQGGDDIWVAAGVYRPDQNDANPQGTNDPEATFDMHVGINIYGGFLGGEMVRSERDPESNESVLTGDIANGAPTNSKHVVTVPIATGGVLNGFTIEGGRSDDVGGGMIIEALAVPFVVRCKFVDNRAGIQGGAGGAVHMSGLGPFLKPSPFFVNCSFVGNFAGGGAGGGGGGAVAVLNYSVASFVNCVFSGNSAAGNGAVVADLDNASVTFTNCSFSRNSAAFGTGGVGGAGTVTIRNCVLWGNDVNGTMDQSAQINASGTVSVKNTCVQGLDPGGPFGGSQDENIGEDPLFADADGADNLIGTIDDDLRLLDASPCVDAGNNASLPNDIGDLDDDAVTGEPLQLDLDRKSRIRHGTVDMGPYEFFCVGDVNDSGIVDIVDFLALLHLGCLPCPAGFVPG